MASRKPKRRRGEVDGGNDGESPVADGEPQLTATATVTVSEGTCLLLRLPNELLTIIFEQVVKDDPLASAIRIASVSRQWRAWALSNPSLWTHAPSVCFLPRQPHHIKPTKVRSIIALAAQRSGNGLTHVDLRSLASRPLHFRQCAEIVARSAQSLVELKIADDAFCACRMYAREPAAQATPESAFDHWDQGRWIKDRVTTPRHIITLVCQAPLLDRLTLELKLSAGPGCTIDAAKLKTPTPTPRTFSLFVSLNEHRPGSLDSGVIQWLNKLTSQVQEFAFFATAMGLAPWAWQRHWSDIASHWIQARVWFDTPQLQALRAHISVAHKVSCPTLECASLIFTSHHGSKTLAQLLKSWPRLHTLTFELDKAVTVQSTLEEIIRVLSPSVHGAVIAPNLRHLGIISPEYFGSALFMYQSPQWATAPWTLEETQHRFFLPPPWCAYGKSNPDLPRSIIGLEEERRRLSDGGTVQHRSYNCPVYPASSDSYTVTTVQGPCQALVSIKLVGLRVPHKVYASLLESSRARVTCYPDPNLGAPKKRARQKDE